jgi:hypothetical protein
MMLHAKVNNNHAALAITSLDRKIDNIDQYEAVLTFVFESATKKMRLVRHQTTHRCEAC